MTQEGRVWLPHVLFEMAEAFGQPVALRFAAEFGGRRLSLPQVEHPDHPVAELFGLEVLSWLIERWPGTALLIPLGPHSSYKRLIAETRRMLANGEDNATITRVVGCHERTVFRHRRALREKKDDGLQGYFDLKSKQ
jgi:hypothetical protein